MRGKKILVVVVCIAMMMSAVYIVLAAEVGGADDPLITLSYLNDVYKPQMKTEVKNEVTAALKAEILKELKAELGGISASEFEVVELNKGQTLILTSSGEIVLRTGSAVCVSPFSDAGLGNLSQGYDILSGKAIPKNNLILVPRADGRGITVSEFSYVMVKGSYTIS